MHTCMVLAIGMSYNYGFSELGAGGATTHFFQNGWARGHFENVRLKQV